jgi:hypothetical protein
MSIDPELSWSKLEATVFQHQDFLLAFSFQSNALSMKWNTIWCKTNCLFNSSQWFVHTCDTKHDVISFSMWASWSVGYLILLPIHYGDKIDRPTLQSPMNIQKYWNNQNKILSRNMIIVILVRRHCFFLDPILW